MDEGALRPKNRVLQPTDAFVTYTGLGGASLPHNSPRNGHARTAFRRFALLAQASDLDADLPGVADSRLAGWRVGNNPGTVERPDSIPSAAPGEPVCGDIVEYPLSERVKEEANDGREKGVAVIVSINKHRNDAWTLPEDILDKVELQVLCPDVESQEALWMPDELETCAFASLGELKLLKSEFNGALDKWKRWKIKDELSPGCGARDAEWEYDIV